MRLTEILTGMLFAKSAQGALFSDFESRKSHLHQETKVDKRGRVTHRWVSNEQEAPKKPRAPRKPKPAAADTQQPQLTLKLPRGVTQAQGTLFDGLLQPVPTPTMQVKPQNVQGSLFDAVQQVAQPAAPTKPKKPRKARKPADSHDTPVTPAAAVAELREAVTEANTNPTPENEQALRAAIKNNRLVTGATDENTSHTAATNGDTPAPEGQQYLVGLPEGIKDRQRKQWNKAAEDLVMELRDHPRATTTEERQLLARYSGNGGIGASLNEYYTPPELGKAMWDVLGKLGSGTGKGLEPSSGPGVLAQFAGDDAHMDMVELSPISAGIANTLFGHRHDVHSMSFEAFRQRNPDSTYNFMVGNPPFGSRDENMFLDDKYQEIKECSRYFTLSSLDHLEEGGIATLVLPAGLARNKKDAEFRARVLARAEVVAIHGLPTDTFARAGTEMATTDVWVLRGRPTAVRPILDEGGTEALKAAGVHDQDFIDGKWHEAHPEQMHGTETQRQGPMGAMVYARDGQLDEGTLQGIVAQTPTTAPQQVPTAAELVEKLKDNPRAIAGYLKEQRGKEGDTRISATGQAQICYGGRWHNVHDDTPMALTQGKQLSDLLTMHAQTLSHGNYDQANNLREQLERLLTEYKAKYGNPHENADLQRLAKDTPDLNNLLAAFQPDGSLAPSLSEDAQAPKVDVDLSDPASVLAHLRRKGQAATTEAYQAVTGKSSPDEAADHLIEHGFAYHPERGVWTAPGEFYSGDSNDIRDSIERGLSAEQPAWARKALEAQRSELQKRVPITPLSDFEVTPRDTWVPEKVLKSYLLSQPAGMLKHLTWDILDRQLQEGTNGTYTVGNNQYYDAYKKKALNFLKRYLTGQGARSDEANDYADLDEGFRDFLAANPEHREAVEEAYAARGAWLEPSWNTDPVDSQIEGWKGKDEGGVTLHSYQNEAIHRSLAQGGGIIALDVGLGKTPTAIAQCYLAKQKGLAKNPVAAVPKSVIGQWRQKALQAKPDARVLVVGAAPRLDKDGNIELDNEGREVWDDVSGAAVLDRQLSQLKTGDYDLVLMTHTTLGRIQYDPMQQLQLIQDEFYSQAEDAYGKASGMSGKLYQQYAGLKVQAMLNQGEITLDDLGKAQEQLKELDLELKEHYGSKSNLSPSEKKDKAKKKEERQRLSFLVAASRALAKEDAHPLKTQWDELGIDHLVIDEAHCFPAGTLVDGKPIENYQVGDVVNAFDHATGRIVKAQVTGVDKRPIAPTQELYRFTLTDGRQVVSTGNHPYFTQDGYVFARHIKEGDAFHLMNISVKGDRVDYAQGENTQSQETTSQSARGDVSRVPNSLSTQENPALTLGQGRNTLLLQQALQDDLSAPRATRNERVDSGLSRQALASPQRADEAYAGTGKDTRSQSQDERYAESAWSSSEGEGREWTLHASPDGFAGSFVGLDGSGMEAGVSDSNEAVTHVGLPHLLQSGLGRRLAEGGSRTGRPIAFINFREGPRPEETGVFRIVRVARVEVLQPGGRGGRDGLCQDGHVYNLEVAQHHNYFAEGVLVHNSFKGLWTYSKSRGDKNIKYLGAPAEPSQRAVDLYYKTKAMREAQGGRGVYLLTATPIKNSPVEIYNMLSYTAPSVFKRLGIHNLDQFVGRYCRIEEQATVDPDTGELKYVSVLAGLKNLSELRRECARFVNRKTATQVGLPLPFNDETTEHIEPKTEQSDLIKWVAKNPVEAARKYLGADIPDEITEGDEEYDKMAQRYALAIPHITRRAELDMEMIDPVKYKGYVSPKVNALLDDLERTTKNGEKTVIFSDVVNMPNPGGDKANPHGYSFHEKLRQLIHERTGVPLEKIAIVNAQTCPDSEDRLKVSNGVKSGQYQIVIGNTGTMGEGINLQHGVANLLHLDVPWNPAVWQQRVGRVVRQGNKLGTVNNKTFLGTRGLDKDIFDTLKGKGVWYDEFWNGESDTMDTDGQNDYRMTPERLAALAIDDPDERAAELERINGGEKANREVAKRIAAVKQFHRLQSARKAQSEAEGVLSRTKEPTEKQRASVAALKVSADALTEKLRNNPAFAPFVHHLDNPSLAVIDAGSGQSWQVGQKFSVTNTDGTTTHVVLTNVNARKGLLQYNHLDLAGDENGGIRNRKQVPISMWAEGETRPYDIHTHVRDFVSSGQVPDPYNNGVKIREVLNQHPEQVREGLRERDSWNPSVHDKRLIRRNGQVMKVTTDQLQEGDHYLINDGAQDTQDVQNWLKHPDTDTSDYYQGLGTALSQAQFEHKRDWPSNKIVAKAESTLSELYTQMRGK